MKKKTKIKIIILAVAVVAATVGAILFYTPVQGFGEIDYFIMDVNYNGNYECEVHITELKKAFEDVFNKLSKGMDLAIKKHIPHIQILPEINENSTLGEQIKYYRRYNKIKQSDLSLKLGFNKNAMRDIENNPIKLVDVSLIKSIIAELDIGDKIKINDDYVAFLLDNPFEKIRQTRKEQNLSRKDFAEILGVSASSIKQWELEQHHISRKCYDRIKKHM